MHRLMDGSPEFSQLQTPNTLLGQIRNWVSSKLLRDYAYIKRD